MTDTSSLLPNNVGITSDLNFSLKPSAVRSRSYKASILPSNGQTQACGNQSIFMIPGGRKNSYLDTTQSYIRYNVVNNDTNNALCFDVCGGCVINRLDVFHASSLLESIQSYNQLYTYILDCQTTSSQRQGLLSYGFDQWGGRAGANIPVSSSQTVCMPLLGLLGLGSSKMIPMGLLSDDIRVELTWESAILGMVYATSNATKVAWSLTGIELELCIVELSDEGESMVQSSNNGDPLYIHTNSWRHYSSQTTANTGTASCLVPARFASAKSLVMLPHQSALLGSTYYSTGSRVNPNIASYSWRIGSSIVPSKPVQLELGSGSTAVISGGAEAYSEVQKAWHALDNSSASGVLSSNVYNSREVALTGTPWFACNTTAGLGYGSFTTADLASAPQIFSHPCTSQNGFCIATEVESMSQRSDLLISGLNTLSSNIFFEYSVNTVTSAVGNYTLDFFCNYDSILCLQDGLLSVRF